MASNPASSELAYWTAYYSARLLVWHGLEDAESWATAIGMMAGIGLLGLGKLLLLLVGLRYFGISFREIWGSWHEDFPAAVPVGLGVVLGFLGSLGATGYDEAAVVVVSRVLSQGVVIAVLEEFLFRGFVFRSMLCSFSEGRAVLASSLLFVAPHFY
jgi:membrane protease YdiL (CAAX protease family)